MIKYDRDAANTQFYPRLMLIFVPAPRCAFNLSGIYPMPPLGIAYLAAHLRKKGFFGTALLDIPAYDLSIDTLPGILKNDPFPLYGLSATTPGLGGAAAVSRMIKEQVNPNALVILGGLSTTMDPEVLFKLVPDIDMIVRGPGEGPIYHIVKAAERGTIGDEIPGVVRKDVWMREGSGKPMATNEVRYRGMPARDLLPMERYRLHPPFGLFPPATTVETARGCHFGCRFCSIPQKVHLRPVEDVIDELEGLVAEGYREVYFIDPTFPIDRCRAMELCRRMIQRKLHLRWACKSRSDTLDEEMIDIMARAGCYMISIGVESGATDILNVLGKDIAVETTRHALRACKHAGIRVLAYVILGAPGETDETVQETLTLLIEEKVAFALFNELLPDPHAPMFTADGEKRKGTEKAIAQHYLTNEPSGNLLPAINVSGISKEQRRKWLFQANRSFYLRPAYIMQRLADLRSPQEIFILAKGLYHFLREGIRVARTS